MIRHESKFGILLRHWIHANPPKERCHYELKDTRGEKSFPFDEFAEHQITYGEAIMNSDKGVFMRNPGGNGEPDYTYMYHEPVFLAIRYPDFFCVIPLTAFVREKFKNKSKSLTAGRAKMIADVCINI